MESEIKANLYPCKHCKETGTCTSGTDGSSCASCVKLNSLEKSKIYTGLSCAVCLGIGQAEPKTERLNKRVKSFLAITVLLFLLLCCFILAWLDNPNFSTFLAFASTLSASIVTYYFTNNGKSK